jgi:hypothetical protein
VKKKFLLPGIFTTPNVAPEKSSVTDEDKKFLANSHALSHDFCCPGFQHPFRISINFTAFLQCPGIFQDNYLPCKKRSTSDFFLPKHSRLLP